MSTTYNFHVPETKFYAKPNNHYEFHVEKDGSRSFFVFLYSREDAQGQAREDHTKSGTYRDYFSHVHFYILNQRGKTPIKAY